ncbi:hypothetical protein [Streptomyces platensis]|uniref:hypothetical protein n=1 Tax=Streptomyces platensis TaxID=58346 RepID=UPI002E26CFFC|nr:hypothetical protein OG424_18060 [Streptomyces platensis]
MGSTAAGLASSQLDAGLPSWSVAKSVVSLLVGQTIERGKLRESDRLVLMAASSPGPRRVRQATAAPTYGWAT